MVYARHPRDPTEGLTVQLPRTKVDQHYTRSCEMGTSSTQFRRGMVVMVIGGPEAGRPNGSVGIVFAVVGGVVLVDFGNRDDGTRVIEPTQLIIVHKPKKKRTDQDTMVGTPIARIPVAKVAPNVTILVHTNATAAFTQHQDISVQLHVEDLAMNQAAREA